MIDFDLTNLRSAAKQARSVADSVGTAKAAGAAALPYNAFGAICSPILLPVYSAVQFGADLLFGSIQGALERSAQGLDDTASDFENIEEQLRVSFNNGVSEW